MMWVIDNEVKGRRMKKNDVSMSVNENCWATSLAKEKAAAVGTDL
jgi:hypothetical protein